MVAKSIFWFSLSVWVPYCHGKEDPRSACDSGPCLNGGQCIDITYPGGPLAFKCACREGYEGMTCQKRIDPCADDPCQNSGVCSQRGEHYHCMCPEAYKGKNCEIPVAKKDPCSEKPCGLHGMCEVVQDRYVCECLTGYHGTHCEVPDTETKVEAVIEPDVDEQSWIIKDVLISILFFITLFAVILVFLCCHCCRVWNRRSKLQAVQEAKKAAGKDPGTTVGWFDLSNQLCYEFFCCSSSDTTDKTALGDRCFADPDNITGVIVPLKDYNSWVRKGFKYDNLVMEADSVPAKNQGNHIQYTSEPIAEAEMVAEPTNDVRRPYVTFERRPSRMSFNTELNRAPSIVGMSSELPRAPARMSNVGMSSELPRAPSRMANVGFSSELNDQTTGEDYGGDMVRRPSFRTGTSHAELFGSRQNSMPNLNSNTDTVCGACNTAFLPDNDQSLDIPERRKSIRSDLHAHFNKCLTPRGKIWQQHNSTNVFQSPGGYACPQNNNHDYLQLNHNEEAYPMSMQNGISQDVPRPEYYGNVMQPIPQTAPYPWIPPPFTYPPYAYPYPLHNNVQNNSNTPPGTFAKQLIPRGKMQPHCCPSSTACCQSVQHAQLGHKCPENVSRDHLTSRGQLAANVSYGDSKMDNLHFVDEDEERDSESAFIGKCEVEGRFGYADTETEDENFERAAVDDDGYGSTNKLSESEAGGRGRDPQNLPVYSGRIPRNYIHRKQKQRVIKKKRLYPRSAQQANTRVDTRRSKSNQSLARSYNTQLNNTEYVQPSNFRYPEESTSDEDKEDYRSFDRSDAVSRHTGDTTRHDSYRMRDQGEDEGHDSSRLVRRGDLWSNSRPSSLAAQYRCSTPRREDISTIKTSPVLEKHSPTNTPKKVKGILKNSSHGGNFNRSASSYILRKSKDSNTSRSNGRRRSMKYRDDAEETD